MARKKKSADAASYGITQLELVTYRAADTVARAVSKDKDRQRDDLKARLLAGATIEPGNLSAVIVPGHRDSYVVPEADLQTFKVIVNMGLVVAGCT
jgi:hypothetical protein